LLTKPDIPMKDLDRERDFDIIQQIVEEGCYLFMLLSTIQLFGMSSLITNRPRVEEERRHEEQEERRHEESITDQLETELEAILEFTFLFFDVLMEFGFYFFFTPNTIDKKKHTAKLQALRKRARELVFLSIRHSKHYWTKVVDVSTSVEQRIYYEESEETIVL